MSTLRYYGIEVVKAQHRGGDVNVYLLKKCSGFTPQPLMDSLPVPPPVSRGYKVKHTENDPEAKTANKLKC